MAIYRLSAQLVKRSAGRSATAAAAYRAGIRLSDERTGLVFDYTRRHGVVHAEIVAPPGAPEWMLDRLRLWNAVETGENRKDAQLARELQLALPHELTTRQRLALVRQFVLAEFVAHGMIADLSVHRPDRQGDRRNHHAHVMLTLRAITDGGFGKKVREWNDVTMLDRWRSAWSERVNQALARHGHAESVDHRSYGDRGIDIEPEPKMGPIATTMERQGHTSRAGADRRATKARNRRRAELAATLFDITAELSAIDAEHARSDAAPGRKMPAETVPTGPLPLLIPMAMPVELPVRRRITAAGKRYLFALWSTLARAVTSPVRMIVAGMKRRHRPVLGR
jgi:hypothetical protein